MKNESFHIQLSSSLLEIGPLFLVCKALQNYNELINAQSIAESKEEVKSLLRKVKEVSEKVGLNLNIQKANVMASSSITSWQIYGETMETVTDFIFLGFKTTADGDCSHEIKRCLLLGRKFMTNLDSRDITLPTKVCLVKAMVFPYSSQVWM